MAGDDFGFSIAISDNHMIVGSPGFNKGHGAAYLYKKINEQWELEKVFENPIQKLESGEIKTKINKGSRSLLSELALLRKIKKRANRQL